MNCTLSVLFISTFPLCTISLVIFFLLSLLLTFSIFDFFLLFFQYFRCYSPVAFGKKTDPNGDYIRKYLPQLKKYPAKFIFEPWKAPLSVQQDCGCVIGKGYPARIVDHDIVVKENMGRMKAAYGNQGGVGDGGDDDVKEEDEEEEDNKSKKSKSSSSSSSTKAVKAEKVEKVEKVEKEVKAKNNSEGFADIFSPPQKKTKPSK